MKVLGNIVWFVFGGFIMSLGWFIVGLLWCCSIVGIPVGIQCLKFAKLTLWPFGKEVEYGKGVGNFLVNILWLIFGGLELAFGFVMFGLLFCVTLIGLPFGLQMFKLGKLALMPFGAKVN